MLTRVAGLMRLVARARRAWLISLALLALVAPGPARAAGDFTFVVLANSCTTTGGDFGHGEVFIKVKVTENGLSGANKFTLAAVAQHYRARINTWSDEYTWDTVRVTFPNDANSYSHKRWWAYDPNDRHEHRIMVTIKVWHNRTVLAKKVFISKSC